MRKIIILIIFLFTLTTFINVYANDNIEYSEWSTERKGYSREEEAIQYGVVYPKRWSEWDIDPATDPTDIFFQYSEDFGSKVYITQNYKQQYQINNAYAKTIYTWDFGEKVTINHFYIDVDCWKSPGADNNFVAPAMQLYVDDKLVTRVDSKGFDHIGDNWEGDLNVQGRIARLDMSDCSGSGRDRTTIVYSYVQTSLIKYRHVIEWDEPTNWRFDTPYELKGGAEAQKPVERKVYRYPLNPIINVDDTVLYEDSTYEYIKELATAIDYDDTNIPSENIHITKFEYLVVDDNGNSNVVVSIDNPVDFDPSLGEKLRVTYVANGKERSATKTVTMIIIKEGVMYDLKIYNRYIDEYYYSKLDDDSKWKQGKRKEKINEAMKWLEGK